MPEENELEQYVTDADEGVDTYDYYDDSWAWWERMLANEEKLIAWLHRLYNTEKDAEERFIDFADTYCSEGTREHKIFMTIAGQESGHARMIAFLLAVMKSPVDDTREHPERYWAEAKKCIKDRETAAGAGYFAEDLSLQRMQVILDHPDTPMPLQEMFKIIHRDESYHTRILAKLAGEHGIKEVVDCHTQGLVTLGLSIKKSSGPK